MLTCHVHYCTIIYWVSILLNDKYTPIEVVYISSFNHSIALLFWAIPVIIIIIIILYYYYILLLPVCIQMYFVLGLGRSTLSDFWVCSWCEQRPVLWWHFGQNLILENLNDKCKLGTLLRRRKKIRLKFRYLRSQWTFQPSDQKTTFFLTKKAVSNFYLTVPL